MGMGKRAGITTTIPVEVILAAGLVPVDLNNIFVVSPDAGGLLGKAHQRGFAQNLCAWIKGIYQAAMDEGIKRVVGVTRGDCSSTEKLLEIWRSDGVETVPFAYPAVPDAELMAAEISRFARSLGTDLVEAEKWRERLVPVRKLLSELDRMTWEEGLVTGAENHLWLVSSSDFAGDPEKFGDDLRAFVDEVKKRRPASEGIRLAYLGVPPIVNDLYDFIEGRGARVVLNEVQRQFSMPGDHAGLAEQYSAFTYPYDTFGRIEDVKEEIARRNIHGVVHYAQTFCHRQMESILFSEKLPVPVLVVEADVPGPLDARTRTRIEAFIEQLSEQQNRADVGNTAR